MNASTRWACNSRAVRCLLAVALSVAAGIAGAAEGRETATDAVRSCTRCHDATEKYPVLSILKSKHAVMADPRTPFADQACITCHGASESHMQAPGEDDSRAAPDIVFEKGATGSADQNQVCLSCHSGGNRLHWKSSAHAFQDLSCSSCHTVHAGEDPVLSTQLQPDVCFGCHKNKRAEIRRPFSHPIREGEMACSDCHNPHGSAGPVLLAAATVNETCYGCHAEKRGPGAQSTTTKSRPRAPA